MNRLPASTAREIWFPSSQPRFRRFKNGGVAADGKSVVWKLKRGVKWSDGQAFTAKDVVFTYNFITNPDVKSTSRESYKQVAGVEVVDDYTVKVTFKDVDPSWYLPFVGVKGMIIPEHVFAPYNNGDAATAPGTWSPSVRVLTAPRSSARRTCC